MSETELKRKLMKIPTALQGRRAAEVVRALDTTKASDAKAPKARQPKKARAGAARSRLEFDAPEVVAPEKKAPAVETAQPFEPDFSRGDSLQLYLREIGQVKLLTPAEEIALAKRIKRGDKSAREHMIKANLRLVVKIARDYENLG